MYPFTITQQNVTLFMADGKQKVFLAGTSEYKLIVPALVAGEWSKVDDVLAEKKLSVWHPDFSRSDDGTVYYKDRLVPLEMVQHIEKIIAVGGSPIGVMKFFERLQLNPSYRSVQQLFRFLQHCDIPIQPDGTFLAYKSVREDWMDHHSGTLRNKPGDKLAMDRNQISDDPNAACHEGLHVGALSYVQRTYRSGKTVLVRVDPQHVVCVPYDASSMKMRVCEYTVEAVWNGIQMEVNEELDVTTPSVSWIDGDEPEDEEPAGIKPLVPLEEPAGINLLKIAELLRKEDVKELATYSLDVLRKYASHEMKIHGASKLPGGKFALISKMLESV